MRLVFDLDGTLIDSDPDILAALNRVLAANGLEPLARAELRPMIGDGAKVLVDRAFAHRAAAAGPEALAAFLDDYEANAVVETEPYPGIVAALEALSAAGHTMAVCTNKPELAARQILARLGLDRFFRAVTGGDTTRFRKPDARHLAATLRALDGVERGGKAVMIGDHANDVAAAAGLGIPSIFVAWGYGKATGTYNIAAAHELPGLIAEMG